MKTINKIQNTQKITPLAATIVCASLLSAAYYAFYIFNTSLISDLILYLLMVLVEVYVLVMMIFSWWTILFHDAGSVSFNDYSSKKFFGSEKKPIVSVIYTCVYEPLSIIEAGLKAISKMEGDFVIYIGDDSVRPEVEALANKYNAVYKTRIGRQYFKAGNINNILKELEGDFIVIFDSDHHPKPNFLTETLPFFADEKVGFVQCPQYYTNTDNIISIGASGAQSIFYELLMPGKNSFNSAICVGTNVVFRKTALQEATGGIIYELSHSEDIHTGLSIHERGWKSVYVPKILATGLAPDTISMFFKQQERWARGGFSILFSRNPLFMKGLSIEQKVQYLFSAFHYFSGFAILYFLLIPVLFLLTGAKPLRAADGLYWLAHFAPFFISKFLLLFYLVEKFDISVISTSISLFPVYIKAFFYEITGRNYDWSVTNAADIKNRSVYDIMFWHYAIVFLSIAAIVVGLLTINDRSSLFMFSVWTILNIAILLHFIFGVLDIERGLEYEK